MKTLTLIGLLLVSFSGFAQSQRKLNKQLNLQFSNERKVNDVLQQQYDSIHEIYKAERFVIKNSRDELSVLVSRAKELSESIEWVYSSLVTLNEAESYRKEYDSLRSIPVIERFVKHYDDVNRFRNSYNYELTDWSEFATKLEDLDKSEQNKELDALIRSMKSENERLSELLLNQNTLLEKSTSIKNEIDSLKTSYDERSENLYDFLRSLREKRNELEKKYAAKGPKGFPPAYQEVFPGVFPVEREYPPVQDEAVFAVAAQEYGPETIPEVVEAVPEDFIFEVTEVQAEFPGGREGLVTYLQKNLNAPANASGKVYVKFMVDMNGTISDVRVMKGIADCTQCNEEVVRVVKAMPKWKPALNKGKPVNSWFNLPVRFGS